LAKLYFRFGAMNSGKSTGLLQVAFNYEERGQRVLLAKPHLDSKGDSKIVSRLGMGRDVDFLIRPGESVREQFARVAAGEDPDALLEHVDVQPVACLLVDEAQFLEPAQVDDLFRIAVMDNVPVLAYGIRTDFRTQAFPGARRLLEIAHSLEELKTICRCGRKAVFNTRRIGSDIVFDGEQVAIDGEDVWYESLCGTCYLEASGGTL
jgi:thymidine kinase